MKPIIYADTLFLFNFFINTVILIITAKILAISIKPLRIGVASGMGAIYSVLMFLPSFSILYTVLLKIGILFGIEYMAFGGETFWRAVKNFCVFLLVNIALGGGFLALIFLTDFGIAIGSAVSGGEIYINLSPFILLFGIVGIYILLAVYKEMCKRRIYEKSLIKRFLIEYNGRTVELNLFLDTGCTICDPINDKPAVIVELNAIRLILNEEELEFIKNKDNILIAYEKGFRIIPYSTIEGDNMIFGIVAEKISGESFEKKRITIGITDCKFGEEYKGIINPELLLRQEESKITT